MTLLSIEEDYFPPETPLTVLLKRCFDQNLEDKGHFNPR